MKLPVIFLSLASLAAHAGPPPEKPGKVSGETSDPAVTAQPGSPAREFAKKLIVPRALFEAAPLADAVEFLRSMARTGMEIDGAPEPFKLNFVVLDPDKRAKPVDLDVKSIPLDELCEKVAAASGMKVRFDAEAVVFHAREGSSGTGK